MVKFKLVLCYGILCRVLILQFNSALYSCIDYIFRFEF